MANEPTEWKSPMELSEKSTVDGTENIIVHNSTADWRVPVSAITEDLQNDVDQLSADLTDLVDISDKFTASVDEVQSFEAYLKAGWAYVTVVVKCTAASVTIGTVANGYRPPVTAYGFMNAQASTEDVGKLNSARIQTNGNILLWANASFDYDERVTFIYPVA